MYKSLLIIIFFSNLLLGQEVSLVTFLDDAINESSGLVKIGDRLITHNDSGNPAELYELDANTGEVMRTVSINNATNVDWEDITFDENYIYIGDFGNNSGSRTDLKVYKISLEEYLTNDSVNAEVINFSYAEQTDYSPSPFTTNFDAESLIVVNDQLYIFSKNWGNLQTDIYALSTTPGTYALEKIGNIQAECLVSGAAYNTETNHILLIGYFFSANYVFELSQIDFNEFSIGNTQRYEFTPPSNASTQIEGITYANENTYLLTSEEFDDKSSALLELETATMHVSQVDANEKCEIYPNPASDVVTIDCSGLKYVELYNAQGLLIRKHSGRNLDVNNLPKGVYYLKAYTKDGNFTKKLIKN